MALVASTPVTDTMLIHGPRNKFLSFEEIGHGKQARITGINHEAHMSCIDFIVIMDETSPHNAAKIWKKKMADPSIANKLQPYIKKFKFPGKYRLYNFLHTTR